MEPNRAHVVIAGGGVAALEALIALSELAPHHVRVTLVTPRADFVSPPAGDRRVVRPRPSQPRRARPRRPRLRRDPPRRIRRRRRRRRAGPRACGSGEELGYDSLLVATGGRRMPAYEHAETIGDDTAAEALHGILADLEEGYLKRLAFVVPPQVAWTLPAYELALLVAHDAWSMGIDDAQLSLVTPEDRPLALFGPQAGAAVGELLAERGIAFVGGVCAEVGRGTLDLHPGGRRMTAERVFALPVVHGDAPAGLPTDEAGFVGTDVHGRVIGVAGVFAAGDIDELPRQARRDRRPAGRGGGPGDRRGARLRDRARAVPAAAARPPADRWRGPLPGARHRRRQRRRRPPHAAGVVAGGQGVGAPPGAVSLRARAVRRAATLAPRLVLTSA